MTASTLDPRILKAARLTRDNAQWLRLRSKVTGRVVAYAIPSAREPGLYWTTNGQSCDCPDAKWRGGVECKHIRAARTYVAQARISRQNATA